MAIRLGRGCRRAVLLVEMSHEGRPLTRTLTGEIPITFSLESLECTDADYIYTQASLCAEPCNSSDRRAKKKPGPVTNLVFAV